MYDKLHSGTRTPHDARKPNKIGSRSRTIENKGFEMCQKMKKCKNESVFKIAPKTRYSSPMKSRAQKGVLSRTFYP